MRVLDELARELGQLRVALGERGQVRQAGSYGLGGRLGGAARGEQAEGPALERVDEVADLVELGGAEAVAAGLGQVARDVEDGLLPVVEGRADVEALPGKRRLVVAGGRPASRAVRWA